MGLDSHKVLADFEIENEKSNKIRFSQGETVSFSGSGWLVSVDNPEKRVQVSPKFREQAESTRLVSPIRNRG